MPFPYPRFGRSPVFRMLAALALLSAWAAHAQPPSPPSQSPIGLWRQVDDETGQSRALVRIYEQGGVLYGRAEKILDPDAIGHRCDRCQGDMKGQPVEGLVFIRGLKPNEGGEWSGGTITDPRDGATYRCSMRVAQGGRALVLRGYLGISLLGRSQTWLREQ